MESDLFFLQRPVVGIHYDGRVASIENLGWIGMPPLHPGLYEESIRGGFPSEGDGAGEDGEQGWDLSLVQRYGGWCGCSSWGGRWSYSGGWV